MSSNPKYPRFLDAGEAALVIEFAEIVDPAINAKVLALDGAMAALALPGVCEVVPTYRSLMIHYDPLVLPRADLVAAVEKIEAADPGLQKPKSLWTIPCCYEPEFAEDLLQVAEFTGLALERVVGLHSGATYRVYMYGFAPGFCYLGGLPDALKISRRGKVRPPHPKNAILVGGGLTLVATFSMPTGWYVIGRTPENMFAPKREPIFLVEVGDELKFAPVDATTFSQLEARATAGEIVAQRKELR
jgi:inhibitor of KinA